MDLNASPLPEDDDEIFQQHFEEDNAPEEHVEHYEEIEPVQPAISFSRREREERMQRMKRQRSDDRPKHAYQPPGSDDNNKKSKPFNRIPPGWVDCPASGQEISCMVPSKVPLSDAFNDVVPPGKRYSSRQVIHQQRVLGRKLGLIIDLTNTTRYYSTSEWNKEGIKHVKIACRGRDTVPDNESVNSFVYEVTQFLSRQKHSKKYILVHCTHGHNRTGFMIVHFLMRTRQISVSEAIQTFVNVRPPGIYKPDYIDALYAFYHERMLEGVVCPSTPEWKTSEFDLNGDAIPDDDDDGLAPSINEHHQEQEQEQVVMSNDDILGDKIPDDQQSVFRQFCYQILKLPGGRHAQFPGSHPVSLTRENLQLLRQRYYYATWKADGTRYMMLITMDGCYLIDRHFNFRRVQMRFPCRHPPDSLAERTHHFTLLDGEMIIDTVPDSRKQERRYLIYDMMALNSVSVVEIPFNGRFKMLEKEIIEPRNNEKQFIFRSRNPCYYRYELEPFRVRRKDFWLLSTVTKLLKEFIPKLSHEADGLIFQGWDDPYVPRTHEGLLKWKYPEMNSVDFLFEINEERQFLYLYDRGKKRLLEGAVVFADNADPSQFSGKIIECSWNSEDNVWVCMRVRVDKGTPNEFNTYRKVMRSITDNITEEVLLGEINEIICLPMYEDKIKADIKARRRGHG